MKTPYVVTIMVGSAGSDVSVLPEPTGDVEAVQAVAEATNALLMYLTRRLVVPDPASTVAAWDRALEPKKGIQP